MRSFSGFFSSSNPVLLFRWRSLSHSRDESRRLCYAVMTRGGDDLFIFVFFSAFGVSSYRFSAPQTCTPLQEGASRSDGFTDGSQAAATAQLHWAVMPMHFPEITFNPTANPKHSPLRIESAPAQQPTRGTRRQGGVFRPPRAHSRCGDECAGLPRIQRPRDRGAGTARTPNARRSL